MARTARQLQAQAAAFESWAKTSDPPARTAPAREAFNRRFEDQVDPERVLPEAERRRRAEQARRAYFAGLARKSVKARRERADR